MLRGWCPDLPSCGPETSNCVKCLTPADAPSVRKMSAGEAVTVSIEPNFATSSRTNYTLRIGVGAHTTRKAALYASARSFTCFEPLLLSIRPARLPVSAEGLVLKPGGADVAPDNLLEPLSGFSAMSRSISPAAVQNLAAAY